MKFQRQLVVFLVLNFGALALGSLFMGSAVSGEWYQSLNKAPWTPPGWVFGAAWFTVMFTFSIFMAKMTEKKAFWSLKIPVVLLFWIQWLLNTSWNFIFFNREMTGLAAVCIFMLLLVVLSLLLVGLKNKGLTALWIGPYVIWLLIANSLNLYIFLYN